jgi:hypothetical protein
MEASKKRRNPIQVCAERSGNCRHSVNIAGICISLAERKEGVEADKSDASDPCPPSLTLIVGSRLKKGG